MYANIEWRWIYNHHTDIKEGKEVKKKLREMKTLDIRFDNPEKRTVKKLKREFEKDKNGKVIGIEVLYFSKISLRVQSYCKDH